MLVVIFLLPILSGGLLVHLLWSDREIKSLILQASLGIGVGLGINSLSYFVYMLFFAGGHAFLAVQIATLLILVAVTVWRELQQPGMRMPQGQSLRMPRTQVPLLALSALVLLISLGSTASYILRRRQGDWDAWMMFNRAARFVYRDQTHWLESFSPQMDPIFHPDYPLFLAMNIASGWDTLGAETPHVPMIQSALFALACAGLFVSALASTKSVGQAAVGLIVFWGTPAVVNEGARELADLPLAYFILATFVAIYLFTKYRSRRLLILAGLAAGLAAWTKNEGTLFVLAGAAGLIIGFRRDRPSHVLLWYAVGLALPLALVLYFKFFMAPPSDVLSNGPARSLQQILTWARHVEILQYLGGELWSFGDWTKVIGIIPVLLAYLLLFRLPIDEAQRPAFLVGLTIVGLQLLGAYGIYLITPYDLTWHLTTSVQRIVLQVFPLIAFLVLLACRVPEEIFPTRPFTRIEDRPE